MLWSELMTMQNERKDKKQGSLPAAGICFRQAQVADLAKAQSLYRQICEQEKMDRYGPKWIYGLYPCDEDFVDWIEKGELFFLEKDGQTAGGFLLQDEPDSLSLHLFGILSEYRHQGLAQAVMAYLDEEALRRGYRKLSLDVIDGNLPAEKLYEKAGYIHVGDHELFEGENGLLHLKDYIKTLSHPEN